MRQANGRKGQRSEQAQVVFYKDGARDESFFAITVNVSDCGVCIFTDRPLEKGEVFLVESALWKKARSATAVWANRLGDTLFEAGLSLC